MRFHTALTRECLLHRVSDADPDAQALACMEARVDREYGYDLCNRDTFGTEAPLGPPVRTTSWRTNRQQPRECLKRMKGLAKQEQGRRCR